MEAPSVPAVSLPLLFAPLTGRSGHGLALIPIYRFRDARPLAGFGAGVHG